MSDGPAAKEGAQLAAVAAAALLLAGCLVQFGFESSPALLLVACGGLAAGLALGRPTLFARLNTAWARRALRAVGPVYLLIIAAQAAGAARPSLLVAPLGLVALLGLALALLADRDEPPAEALAIGLLLAAPGAALLRSGLFFVELREASLAVTLAWLAAVALGLLVLTPLRARPGFRRVAQIAAVVLGLLVRGGAIVASPDPVIDVHTWLVQAPEALARGDDPYGMALDSPYGTLHAERFHINMPPDPHPAVYPPGIILAALPAAAGLDPRWVLVLGWLLLAALAAGPGLGTWAAMLVLLLPTAAFTLENAWFDVLMTLGFVAGLRWRGRAAGVAWGWALTVKQTALFLLPAMLAARRERRTWVAAVVTVAVIVLPFVAWGPAAFVRDVITGHLSSPIVGTALSVPTFVHRLTGVALPGAPLLLVAAGLAVWAAWRAGRRPGQGVLAAAFALWAFTILNRKAFINYYEVVAALLLCGAAWLERADEPDAGPG